MPLEPDYTLGHQSCGMRSPPQLEGERMGDGELQNEPPALEGRSQAIGAMMAKKTKKKLVRH